MGQGADVHAKTKNGHTVLRYATEIGQTLAMTWLIEQGGSMSIAEPVLPSTVAVVGANEGYGGLYEKQQGKLSGRVLYRSTRADSNQAIWYMMCMVGNGALANWEVTTQMGWPCRRAGLLSQSIPPSLHSILRRHGMNYLGSPAAVSE